MSYEPTLPAEHTSSRSEEGFRWEVAAHDDLSRDGWTVDYFTFLVS